jgi:outer membrane protein OmpA-like peptidoglycan-associated protein
MLKKYLVVLWFVVYSLSNLVYAQDVQVQSTKIDNNLYLLAATILSDSKMDETTPKNNTESGSILTKKVRIINLGPIVNWKGLDYAPTVSADGKTLFFVSNRPGSILNREGKPSHDFWAAKKNERLDTNFSTPYNIDTSRQWGELGVNTALNEGAASIAADGQSLYFTGCNREDGFGSCDIYKTTIEGDKWGRPINLGPNVNTDKFESQPSIAPDQSRLYFVSTRKGPNSDGDNVPENMDIWYSDWDENEEDWKPAVNLSAINTKGEDVSPFIAADGVTLFFASNGVKPSYGGKDFYVTRYDPSTNNWSKPENLGEPINTSGEEQFITLPASGDIIYFSSTRKDLLGYQGDLDLFMAFVPTFFRNVVVKITVIDECTQEFIPSKISMKNPITGKTFIDSVTMNKKEMTYIVTNAEYGNPKDSINTIDYEITAENINYVPRTIVQRVVKPSVTENPEEAGKVVEEINITVTLGERPVLASKIAEANYISRMKKFQPQLAGYNGLVMEQIQTWDLYPLLNYVFFDLGSSKIPDRYILFKSPDQTRYFSDTTIAGGTLNKYYHILNIYGFRLKQYPDAKIEIVGTTDGTTPEEKRPGLSQERAQVVYDYFKNIWGISPDRMKLTFLPKPKVVSNLKDSLGIVENRRAEILCDDWRIMQPVFDKYPKTFPEPDTMRWILKNGIDDKIIASRRIEIKRNENMWKLLDNIPVGKDTIKWDWTDENGNYPKDEAQYVAQMVVRTINGAECKSDPIVIPVMQVSTEQKKVVVGSDSTLERYSLILFPFDRSDAGPINERIMKEYVYERVRPTSWVEVVGHTDVVGLYDHNKALSERRATTVKNGINAQTKGKYGVMYVRGVGEDEPLYTNDLPEGRFYNRTVQVIIRTPIEEYEQK